MGKKKGKNKSRASAKTPPQNSTPRRTPGKRTHGWPDDDPPAPTPRFSLADEARFVLGHRKNAFDAAKKLRNLPVAFVSAGLLEGTLKDRAASDAASPPDNTRAMAHLALRSPSPALSHASSASSDEVVFQGRATAPASLSAAASRLESPLPQKHVAAVVQPDVKPETAPPANDSDTDVLSDAFATRRGDKPTWEGNTTAWEHRSKPRIGWLPVAQRPDMDAFLAANVDPRNAAMDDYMQNMEEFGLTADLINSGFARREMDLDAGSHNDWESASQSDGEGQSAHQVSAHQVSAHTQSAHTQSAHTQSAHTQSAHTQSAHTQSAHTQSAHTQSAHTQPTDPCDSDLLHHLDGMSTSSDAMDTVAQILSKRNRTSGVQYLCVYQGSVPDDAHWLPGGYLQSTAEKELIHEFEADILLRKKTDLGDSTSDSEDEEEDDDSDDDSINSDDNSDNSDNSDGDDFGFGDEELDDETIARVLQKQEELGLGADELMLYAADDYFAASSRADDYIPLNVSRSRGKQKRGGRRNREPTFPSASAMADALDMDPYNGFDIMDTDRPSLKPKKKGRRGQMPFELLDDSDLNEQLQNAWENDRNKKRLKKAEREELRQQGLLGRKGKAPNLKVKYKDGIMMEDVLEEMREFLVGDMQTLALPPMDASRRATIHQAAANFKLTSRSRGDGFDRFTVLTKTSRTRTYTDSEFDKAMLHKGLLYRLTGPTFSKKGDRPRKADTVRFGARAKNKASIGYRDGETVGANAPEIGPENKGHALLAKMGWSKGMALGALDNKGILQPIPHTVKMTKAGLQ